MNYLLEPFKWIGGKESSQFTPTIIVQLTSQNNPSNSLRDFGERLELIRVFHFRYNNNSDDSNVTRSSTSVIKRICYLTFKVVKIRRRRK